MPWPFGSTSSTPSSHTTAPPSPFFKPSTPSVKKPLPATPGGTRRYKKTTVDKETKSSLTGTAGNLVNAIVGAGIVGIPYAVRETGLVAGVAAIAFCAVLTEKSLRLLIETAKHVDVPSYEMLLEACFGRWGFYGVSLAMFIMSYGAMVSYLIVVKDTLPVILGYAADDIDAKRAVLTISSMIIMFPLSCQRDMADLAKTSTLSVIFDIIMVTIVTLFAPTADTISSTPGGLSAIISSSTIYPRSFFVGLGVLSFAFVCQHSAFIIAGSLLKPTKKRWSHVTAGALSICGTLATCMGAVGYLAFGDRTAGNVLNNFESVEDERTRRMANVARGLLCTTMFFVYPLESFVSRHVTVVTLFVGRRAHEGDDHAVLKRWDRRMGLTMFLYLSALIPALIFEDVGVVLSVTGAVGGSALSYIGPGVAYLGVHGDEFLKIVEGYFPLRPEDDDAETTQSASTWGICDMCFNTLYYALLMPVWCAIAKCGHSAIVQFGEKEALKSPHLNRLGKIVHKKPSAANKYIQMQVSRTKLIPPSPGPNPNGMRQPYRNTTLDDMTLEEGQPFLARANSLCAGAPVVTTSVNATEPMTNALAPSGGGGAAYGSTDRAIAAAIAQKQKRNVTVTKWEGGEEDDSEEEEDPQEDPPAAYDFAVAIFYIIFGTVALSAGIVSIYVQ